MILYHGSNVEVKEIDLNRSEVGKDFGVGFYLTVSKEQAERMASRRARLYGGEPVRPLSLTRPLPWLRGSCGKIFSFIQRNGPISFWRTEPTIPGSRFTNTT